jgi:hypothetical protein
MIRAYKDATGKDAVDMREVAKWAVANGWQMPKPEDPLDRLARDLSRAAAQEVRTDSRTGRPYRANHVYITKSGDVQQHLWIDIDVEKARTRMFVSLTLRRDQMVSDGVKLTNDAEHWNSINPGQEPIQLVMDFTEDIEERLTPTGGDDDAG